jgi:hypothetical protein
MSASHQWVSYTKGRICITGCAGCGQVLLPTNEDSECLKLSLKDNPLVRKGYRISGAATYSPAGSQVA